MTWILNLILPGTGLIVRRREWLGMAMAAVFAICGNVGIAGRTIAPEAVPGWLTVLAIVLAVLSWVLAQILCYRQGRVLSRMEHVLRQLLANGRSALESNDLTAARRALGGASAIDEENIELHALMACLSKKEGAEDASPCTPRTPPDTIPNRP
ncbi:MAG: hypothetical protein ACE5EC_07005 [Phycisphaerae bacterium]